MKQFELAVLPSEAAQLNVDAYVVVDVLRATTTIATLFAHGLDDLVAVDDIEAARRIAREEGRLLFGEEHGRAPEGFDHGNSPLEVQRDEVAGRGAVLVTTNGTRALCLLAERAPTATGALSNLRAAAEFLARHERAAVVCSGQAGGTQFAIEDFAVAGAIIQRAVRLAPGANLGDAAGMALDWMGWEEWIASEIDRIGRPGHLIGRSRHAAHLRSIGLGADIEFAGRENTSMALPMVAECSAGRVRLVDAAAG